MAELLLVNPARRKSRRRKKNPMPRALAAYWSKHRRRRKNPSGTRRRRKHHASRRRTNPSLRGIGTAARAKFSGVVVPTLHHGALGAVGALGNDLIVGQVQRIQKLQPWANSTMGAAVLKVLGALAIGVGGSYFGMTRGVSRTFADGAMTVALHDLAKSEVQGMLPTWLPMGEYLTFAPTVGYSGGASDLMGQYLSGPGAGLGEYIAADVGNADWYSARPGGDTMY